MSNVQRAAQEVLEIMVVVVFGGDWEKEKGSKGKGRENYATKIGHRNGERGGEEAT